VPLSFLFSHFTVCNPPHHTYTPTHPHTHRGDLDTQEKPCFQILANGNQIDVMHLSLTTGTGKIETSLVFHSPLLSSNEISEYDPESVLVGKTNRIELYQDVGTVYGIVTTKDLQGLPRASSQSIYFKVVGWSSLVASQLYSQFQCYTNTTSSELSCCTNCAINNPNYCLKVGAQSVVNELDDTVTVTFEDVDLSMCERGSLVIGSMIYKSQSTNSAQVATIMSVSNSHTTQSAYPSISTLELTGK